MLEGERGAKEYIYRLVGGWDDAPEMYAPVRGYASSPCKSLPPLRLYEPNALRGTSQG